MSDPEVIELIGYCIGAFGLGFGMGTLTAAIKRSLDLI
jgi:hypothetical protein